MNLIRDLVESPEFRETEASRAILEDKALEAHIRIKLRDRLTTGTGVTDVEAPLLDLEILVELAATVATAATDPAAEFAPSAARPLVS